MRKQKKSVLLPVLLFAMVVNLFTGCTLPKPSNQELSVSGFAFNTTYTITAYAGGSQKLLDSCVSKCSEYETVFSRTEPGSELYQVNALEDAYLMSWYAENVTINNKAKVTFTKKQQKWFQDTIGRVGKKNIGKRKFSIGKDGGLTVTISDELAALIKRGLYYCKLSHGSFDIAIEPVSSLWDFTAEKPKVPKKEDIKNGLNYVDYTKISLKGNKLTFAMPGMGLDLGGIAKGYIADGLKSYLEKNGVTSGMINLGGNVLCIGKKADGTSFNIGIQQPFADRNETIAAVKVEDKSIVSSGIYERYFKTKDGKLYHHILNPKTGYSYQNNLVGVTIVSDKSVDGDGFSTTAFALGLHGGLALINSTKNVEAVFITTNEKLHYSKGFQKMLTE